MVCISNKMNCRSSPSLETIAEVLLHSVMTARIKQMVKVSTHHHTTPTCSEVNIPPPIPPSPQPLQLTLPGNQPRRRHKSLPVRLVLHQKHNDRVQKIGEGLKRFEPYHTVRPLHPAHLPQVTLDVLAQHRLNGPRCISQSAAMS